MFWTYVTNPIPRDSPMKRDSDAVGAALCWTVIILAALYLLAQVIRWMI